MRETTLHKIEEGSVVTGTVKNITDYGAFVEVSPGVVGLLHDFDYERYPDAENHPWRGSEYLRTRGLPEEMIRAAVWGMLPKNQLSRHLIIKLKVYAGPEHPHQAQQPKPLPI